MKYDVSIQGPNVSVTLTMTLPLAELLQSPAPEAPACDLRALLGEIESQVREFLAKFVQSQ